MLFFTPASVATGLQTWQTSVGLSAPFWKHFWTLPELPLTSSAHHPSLGSLAHRPLPAQVSSVQSRPSLQSW